MTLPILLGALVFGPVQFDRPGWLVLIPVLGVVVLVIARRSLSGLGPGTRIAAIGMRLLVVAAVAGAMAEPRLRREAEGVAVTVVLDVSRSVPPSEHRAIEDYLARVSESSADLRTDRLGVVTVARDAYVQSLPSRLRSEIERQQVGEIDASNLAAGLRLAVAVAPDDAASRVLLVSDGNETTGSLLSAAETARAADVPVDVLPIRYEYPAEVIVERVVAPANVRGGQAINLTVIVTSTTRTAGRLVVTENGETVDLDPGGGGMGVAVELDPGKNVLSVPIAPRLPGPVTYEAVFEPTGVVDEDGRTRLGDSISENNRASAVTFVGSEGWVLLVADAEQESAPLEKALGRGEIKVRRVQAQQMPESLTGLNAFEAVVLVNQPAYVFSESQQENLRRYIHDSGGGLVMIGGPDSFGAGGWIGSPLEDALPVQLDPPQKRQLPMGALAIVLDASGSMGQGVSGTTMNQQQLANHASIAAVETLSRLDRVTVVSFSGGYEVVVPLMAADDQFGIARRIRSIGPGGGTNMFPAVDAAWQQLLRSPAGVKHLIVLSDGHTMGSNTAGWALAQRINTQGGTISTVAVGDGANAELLEGMARHGGGRYYQVNSSRAIVELPQIFMKEARTVRRSLIWEGDPFSPRVEGVPTETMRGVASVPPITGYVVTAPREGLSQVTLTATQVNTEDPTAEPAVDPIAAQWQYGLGRVVAFTGSASTRWSAAWVGWSGFGPFWEQHVRWAMRPTGSANVRVVTEERGEETLVIVEALDEAGERLNFADFEARVANPDGTAADVNLRQVGPGRYEARVKTPDAGSYVVSMTYDASGGEDGRRLRGAVQAAISKPFADEFRALETNLRLLRQVALTTGGEVLTRDPAVDKPWRRGGLTMPVSTRAVWLAVAVLSLGLFIVDVGVRRVRVEPRAVLAAVGGLFGRSTQHGAGEQIGSLRAAREKARERLVYSPEAARADEAGEAASSADRASPEPVIALSGEAEKPAQEGLSRPSPAPAETAEDEDGMSRLMRAKRRASEEYRDE